jgi:hypothetical protein
MITLKNCKFCGREFRNQSGCATDFCQICSEARRKLAGNHFRLESGESVVVGNYLLSERRAATLGVRARQ